MKIIFFSLLLLFFNAIEINAQECKTPCPYYSDFVKMAQADTVKNTQTKLNYYRAAIVAARDCHCPELEQRAYDQIDTLFIRIEADKIRAETQFQRAEAQSKIILEQQEKVEIALTEAEAANDKNMKIINAMDFYDGKFALAFKNQKYGFIDKDGNSKLGFEYNRGEPFDAQTGFAEMEILDYSSNKSTKYFIDTIGHRYQLFNISEEYMILLKNKLTEKEKQKGVNSKLKNVELNLELVNKKLSSSLNKNNEKIALQFQDTKSNTISSVLNYLAKESKICDRVEVLILKGDDLKQFPEVIAMFRNLKYINIKQTRIKTLPKSIGNLKKLKKLEFSNSIETVPLSVYNLKHLEALDLSFIGMKTLPESVGNLKRLKNLILPQLLEELPSSIYNLENLEVLDFTYTDLKTLPENIGNLKKLKELEFSDMIEDLPSSIYELENLEVLDLTSADLETLPESIGNLKKLKRLELPKKIKKVPSSIYELENLEVLDLYSIDQKELPETIGNLKNLKKIAIQAQLDNIPLGIYNLEKLEFLLLEGMKRTTKLSDAIGKLKQLKELEISFPLETLPESIVGLINLKILTLYNTKLKELPEGIGKLVNLNELWLPSSLETLPESIVDLINLEILIIEDNRNLKHIPDISKLKKLKEFSFFLHTDKNYISNLKELKTLQEKLPDCTFYITNEKGEEINVKRK